MIDLKEIFSISEVAWKPLGEVGEFQRGKRFVKKDIVPEGIPCIHYGEMYTHYGVWAIESKSFLRKDLVSNKNLRVAQKGDVVMVAAGEAIEDIGSATAWLNDNEVVIHDACFSFRSNLSPKYIAYFSRTREFQKQIRRHVSSGKISAINERGLSKVCIPIPCPAKPKKSLNIQQKIVDILDTFAELTTELTTELTAELTAREKQYAYYREELFKFGEGEVDWLPLGDESLGELIRGSGLPKSDFSEEGVPAIHYGQIYTYYGTHTTETISFVSSETAKKLKKVDTGDVIITNTSENIEDVGKSLVYLGTETAVTGGHATIFKPTGRLSAKFFAYYTQTFQFYRSKRKLAKGAKVIDVSAKDLAKIKIPVPTPEEQARIVTILDQFDTLTASISEGLPKAIELRQKQYEYYRNALLNFPKNED